MTQAEWINKRENGRSGVRTQGETKIIFRTDRKYISYQHATDLKQLILPILFRKQTVYTEISLLSITVWRNRSERGEGMP